MLLRQARLDLRTTTLIVPTNSMPHPSLQTTMRNVPIGPIRQLGLQTTAYPVYPLRHSTVGFPTIALAIPLDSIPHPIHLLLQSELGFQTTALAVPLDSIPYPTHPLPQSKRNSRTTALTILPELILPHLFGLQEIALHIPSNLLNTEELHRIGRGLSLFRSKFYVYSQYLRSLAGAAIQGVPGSRAEALTKRTKRRSKFNAYVVFFGLRPGVYSSW